MIGVLREMATINLIRCAHPAQVTAAELSVGERSSSETWTKYMGMEALHQLRTANTKKNEKQLLENRLKMCESVIHTV